ncbi:DUF3422 family protein [Paracoccus sp. JM45]|uniref:DUF3422 family protein n=1 Tax=Paracoccus sp. JM45 TaxID=2283626 RepID=UPI000E6C5C00|nr:DUF3422 domain-containing protein [Paracoccus sp. JM45]RJE80050.1 DUF3422 domain-containing protein [Paracoccus sp. JM45]
MDPAREHPLRFELVNELHARPSPRMTVPSTAAFVAFKEPKDAANRDYSQDAAHLATLVARHGGPRPDPDDSHYQGQLGRHDLKWESHTEFVTYMAMTPGLPIRPFDPSAAAIFSNEWQDKAPGKRVAAVLVQVDVLPEDPSDAMDSISGWFANDSLAAIWVLDQAAMVAGDFRIDDAGLMRFAVFVRPGTTEARIGRLVHRLVELETYRAMSMLGLGRARGLGQRLNELEPRLTAILESMTDDDRPAEQMLHDLLTVSTQLETEAVQHSFRFGATGAYQAIVSDRIDALRETRFQDRQMMTEFMRRRYEPAMRTIKSTEQRLSKMMERAARAAELLRTRVDVERSAQNQDIMKRMDRRADLQLRLQHTVEGLSVVAISYYAVGLLGHALAPVSEMLGIEETQLVAVLTPVAVLAVWLMMRQVHKKLHRDESDL